MIARGNRVGSAALVRVVIAAGNQASVGKVLPGGLGKASVAAVTAASAAGDEILSRNVEVGLALTLNANTIGHSFDSAESPALN
jgi:H+/gluconate symporter-like permease